MIFFFVRCRTGRVLQEQQFKRPSHLPFQGTWFFLTIYKFSVNMPSMPAIWRSKRSFCELFLLSCVLALAILYGVKSWRGYFFIGLAEHWDPKLMGEWMAWNAHNILHGHFLVPNYDANFFYPHSYTLAFSELLWPESFLYALFYALTANPFFSFNATMLSFWTLSGILLFILLRYLEIDPLISALGSLIYCLMPFRMPYYVEFNMVLVFIFPLMIFLLVRWLKDPSWRNALWFCLGYMISATSCLYYTIMAIIIMAFIFLAFLASDRSLLSNRKFYLSSALIAFGVLAISVIYLYPYALLRIQGGYQRSSADYLKYFAQPMQYLDTGSAALLRWLKIPRPRFTETFLFPGTALCILVLVFFIHKVRQFHINYSSLGKVTRYISGAKFLFWFLFWSAILVHAYRGPVPWLKPFDPLLYYIAFALILLSITGLFFQEKRNQTPQVLLAGLSAAAVICFFISFGPFISVGPDSHRLDLARGPFLDLASWNPLFSAVRTLTRFSIVILTYLIVAGCYVLNRLAQKNKKVLWVLPVLAAILVYEARVMVHYKFEDCTALNNSQVIKKAQNLPGDYVLFELPIAIRKAEADIILTTIGKFPLIIDGWSGFNPDYYERLFSYEEGKWDVSKIFPWVKEIWPPAYLIIDKSWVGLLEMGWKKPFPWDELNQSWELISKDRRFALYRQKYVICTANQIIRRVRTDVLKAHPLLCFKAHSTVGISATISVMLNHKTIGENIPLSESWKEYVVSLPTTAMGNIKGEEVDIYLSSFAHAPHQWEVKDIDFRASK
jgi:hypothetical protein